MSDNMSQPTKKQIDKLFAEDRKNKEALNDLALEITKLKESIDVALLSDYKYKCVFCGVMYRDEALLDAHLHNRGLH